MHYPAVRIMVSNIFLHALFPAQTRHMHSEYVATGLSNMPADRTRTIQELSQHLGIATVATVFQRVGKGTLTGVGGRVEHRAAVVVCSRADSEYQRNQAKTTFIEVRQFLCDLLPGDCPESGPARQCISRALGHTER